MNNNTVGAEQKQAGWFTGWEWAARQLSNHLRRRSLTLPGDRQRQLRGLSTARQSYGFPRLWADFPTYEAGTLQAAPGWTGYSLTGPLSTASGALRQCFGFAQLQPISFFTQLERR
jgi:hypothetical protein